MGAFAGKLPWRVFHTTCVDRWKYWLTVDTKNSESGEWLKYKRSFDNAFGKSLHVSGNLTEIPRNLPLLANLSLERKQLGKYRKFPWNLDMKIPGT